MVYVRLAAVAVVLALTGCVTAEGRALRDVAKARAAALADEALDNAIYASCNPQTIASVRRRFGSSEEGSRIYREWCAFNAGAGEQHDVIGPAE